MELLDCVTPGHLANVSDLLTEVTAEEQQELRRLLQRVRSSLLSCAREKPKKRGTMVADRYAGPANEVIERGTLQGTGAEKR